MCMTLGSCDCNGKSKAELKVSWVLRRVDCRLRLLRGGNSGKGDDRGGIGGAIGVSCSKFSDCGDSVSTVWAVVARKVF